MRMSEKKYECAFEEVLNLDEYENAQEAMYQLVRKSFKAGWDAAGGEPLRTQDKFQLMRKKTNNEPPK